MDAVYAWDQPDFDLYVSGGDHYPAAKVVRFQKTLGAAGWAPQGVIGCEHQELTG